MNIGDSYATGAGKACSPGGGKQGDNFAGPRGYRGGHDDSPKHAKVPDGKNPNACVPTFQPNRMPLPGCKPKDLIGVPWMLAFALRADGWWLRSEIIWRKNAPMPESVRDRPTRAHEQIFLLSKSQRYFYDWQAIAEPLERPEESKRTTPAKFGGADKFAEASKQSRLHSGNEYTGTPTGTRNKRDVWTLSPMATPEAHFATFPIELPETCLRAGCPPEGKRCDCGEIIETPTGTGPIEDPSLETGRAGMNRPRRADEGTRPITRGAQRQYAEQMKDSPHRASMEAAAGAAFAHYVRTDKSGASPLPPDLLAAWLANGWLQRAKPCECPVEPAGTVLDPFCGAGTTGLACLKNGRAFLGIELNEKYIEIANKRARDRYALFAGSELASAGDRGGAA